ncbi:DUF1697 domain-containing protein [bacterium]|jgi:uncharacterized protein (DUF1697 family)|nr:DUF1697 domain-containing protein [bacterium]
MTYIALVRGINVGGKTVKMAVLKEIFEDLGYEKIRTYVQSGNVVFEAGKASPDFIAGKIEKEILKKLGMTVPVLVQTPSDLKKVIVTNPFLKKRGVDPTKLHVTFLSGKFSKIGMAKFERVKAGKDQYELLGHVIYLHCPTGYGKTKFNNTFVERALATEATTRNWRTVNALYEMASE